MMNQQETIKEETAELKNKTEGISLDNATNTELDAQNKGIQEPINSLSTTSENASAIIDSTIKNSEIKEGTTFLKERESNLNSTIEDRNDFRFTSKDRTNSLPTKSLQESDKPERNKAQSLEPENLNIESIQTNVQDQTKSNDITSEVDGKGIFEDKVNPEVENDKGKILDEWKINLDIEDPRQPKTRALKLLDFPYKQSYVNFLPEAVFQEDEYSIGLVEESAILISNLPLSITPEQLASKFSAFGVIRSTEVPKCKLTYSNLGIARIVFGTGTLRHPASSYAVFAAVQHEMPIKIDNFILKIEMDPTGAKYKQAVAVESARTSANFRNLIQPSLPDTTKEVLIPEHKTQEPPLKDNLSQGSKISNLDGIDKNTNSNTHQNFDLNQGLNNLSDDKFKEMVNHYKDQNKELDLSKHNQNEVNGPEFNSNSAFIPKSTDNNYNNNKEHLELRIDNEPWESEKPKKSFNDFNNRVSFKQQQREYDDYRRVRSPPIQDHGYEKQFTESHTRSWHSIKDIRSYYRDNGHREWERDRSLSPKRSYYDRRRDRASESIWNRDRRRMNDYQIGYHNKVDDDLKYQSNNGNGDLLHQDKDDLLPTSPEPIVPKTPDEKNDFCISFESKFLPFFLATEMGLMEHFRSFHPKNVIKERRCWVVIFGNREDAKLCLESPESLGYNGYRLIGRLQSLAEFRNPEVQASKKLETLPLLGVHKVLPSSGLPTFKKLTKSIKSKDSPATLTPTSTVTSYVSKQALAKSTNQRHEQDSTDTNNLELRHRPNVFDEPIQEMPIRLVKTTKPSPTQSAIEPIEPLELDDDALLERELAALSSIPDIISSPPSSPPINPSGSARTEGLCILKRDGQDQKKWRYRFRVVDAIRGQAYRLGRWIPHASSALNLAQQLEDRASRIVLARSRIHDWGLFAVELIQKGELVIEYVGELIRSHLADVREKAYLSKGIDSSYLFRLNDQYVIDATTKGSIARFINHSCEPNCSAKITLVDATPRILIFATEDIRRAEEITYDYQFPLEEEEHKIKCLCGTPSCRGYLN